MQEAIALRCECGHRIRCELIRYGERVGSLVFFDQDEEKEASQIRGERSESCPGCGRRLDLVHLLLKDRSG